MEAFCPQQTENEDRVWTHAVTHEQKNRGGNNGTKRIHGCGNPAAKPPKSSETVYKASLSNLHTHEATGSSPVVSTKTTKSELVPNRGWVRICLLFAILYNVAGHPEADTSALSTFNDKNQVAAYAVNGFAWAVSNKVVGGTSNTTLSPSGTATRAQIAVILIRYLENVVGATFPEVTPSQPETKPEQGDATTVPSDVDAYVKTLPEDVQHAISAWYKDLFFSNPEDVKAAGIQKRADKPTLGYTATANKNGYHTECTLDLSGAVLDYDVVDIMNRYRHEDGRSTHDAVWAYGDMLEEQALAGAKHPQLSEDSMWAGNVTKADSLEQAMQIFYETGKLTTFMGNASDVIAAAHYTNSEGDTYYTLVKANSAKNPCGNVKAAQNNYDIQ